jgi:hypothetical protein
MRWSFRPDERCTAETECKSEWLVSMATSAYADVMYATAVVGGKVIRFKLSPALVRAHRRNRGKTMIESEAAAFVANKRRTRALRRGRRDAVRHP